MPHIQIEYSSNLGEFSKWSELFGSCHKILEKTLPTQLENCKSRAIRQDVFHLADGALHHAFVHIELKVLSGRSDEILQSAQDQILRIVEEFFADLTPYFTIHFSMNISELSHLYVKKTSARQNKILIK